MFLNSIYRFFIPKHELYLREFYRYDASQRIFGVRRFDIERKVIFYKCAKFYSVVKLFNFKVQLLYTGSYMEVSW